MSQIRVLIVEDEPVIAADIAQCLEDLDYCVCGKAMSVFKARYLLETTYPDIVLLDINLEGHREGIELATLIKEKYHIPYVFLTSYSDRATIKEAKILEPSGYIVKPFNERDLYATLEIALYNYAQMQKRLFSPLDLAIINKKNTALNTLSQREFDLLLLITEGYTNAQIAEKSFISINTVKTHLKNLFVKLDVSTRTAAINRARELMQS